MSIRTLIYLCLILTFATGCDSVTQNMSKATPKPLPDGTVLLLRKGTIYGAIILERQREFPEQVDFRWYYRDDGGSILDPLDQHVKSGRAQSIHTTIPEIRFERFIVPWSIAATGSGYVYYDRLPSEPPQPNELQIAITSLSTVDRIDANDAAWNYRSAPPAYYTFGGRWYFD